MDQVDGSGALPGVRDDGGDERGFIRRLAAASAPLHPLELTEWERIALGRFALADPELFQVAARIALTALQNMMNGLPVTVGRALDRMAVLCCDRCLERVLYDVDGAMYDWPPRPHDCGLMSVPLRRTLR